MGLPLLDPSIFGCLSFNIPPLSLCKNLCPGSKGIIFLYQMMNDEKYCYIKWWIMINNVISNDFCLNIFLAKAFGVAGGLFASTSVLGGLSALGKGRVQ